MLEHRGGNRLHVIWRDESPALHRGPNLGYPLHQDGAPGAGADGDLRAVTGLGDDSRDILLHWTGDFDRAHMVLHSQDVVHGKDRANVGAAVLVPFEDLDLLVEAGVADTEGEQEPV